MRKPGFLYKAHQYSLHNSHELYVQNPLETGVKLFS